MYTHKKHTDNLFHTHSYIQTQVRIYISMYACMYVHVSSIYARAIWHTHMKIKISIKHSTFKHLSQHPILIALCHFHSLPPKRARKRKGGREKVRERRQERKGERERERANERAREYLSLSPLSPLSLSLSCITCTSCSSEYNHTHTADSCRVETAELVPKIRPSTRL